MVRVALPAGSPYYAEISGGRHRFTVRFLEQKRSLIASRPTERDVEFDLAAALSEGAGAYTRHDLPA